MFQVAERIQSVRNKILTRKPIFWLIFLLLSISGILFTVRYFGRAFPLVNLDLRINRQQAMDKARQLAKENGWGTPQFRQAASFQLDSMTQHYVELEAGGNDAFRQMLKGDFYSPYTWVVRHFQEGEKHEVRLRFTPAGEFYGFTEQLPEDESGAVLTVEAARAIAETAATDKWSTDLNAYQQIESSKETRPGGRIDHTFVYERPNLKINQEINQGHYRLTLVIGGDRLTALNHWVKIPEEFDLRYKEMRSANNTIALVASMVMVLIYILGGCVIGSFFLFRQGWIIWKPALYMGVFVAGLQALAQLNQLPLSWMVYDTALSTSRHILEQLIETIGTFIIFTVLMTLSFMGAESLSRKAFPHHLQLWHIWSPEVASSTAVVGRTIGGYLLLGLMLAFVVGFYFINSRLLGWWSPSEALFNPDVLAVYSPWLSSIAISLQAGFWEECLFRAVPLAGAALLGKHFGHRWLWIVAAFILQAIVFGAGHANYPAQPAYARLIELLVPSCLFASVYLVYGLLPVIVLHYVYDVVLIALPLFVSSTTGIWFNQMMVILLALVPIWILIYARFRMGSWHPAPEISFNRAWSPTPAAAQGNLSETTTDSNHLADQTNEIKTGSRWLILGVGVIGLFLWYFLGQFQNPIPAFEINGSEALVKAKEALKNQQIDLGKSWQAARLNQGGIGQTDRFVWQQGGKEVHQQMLDNYLDLPRWVIRYAQFDPEIELTERAEEYLIHLKYDGKLDKIVHQLPEARDGATLLEETARELAHSVLVQRFQLNPSQLEEISADLQKRPNRRDWTFTFRDHVNYLLQEATDGLIGEARITVRLAGDEVVDAYRYVHVPEKWKRWEREKNSLLEMVKISWGLLPILVTLAGFVLAIVSWSRGNFSVPIFIKLSILLSVVFIFDLANGWATTKYFFNTSEPLTNQFLFALGQTLIQGLSASLGLALIAGLLKRWRQPETSLSNLQASLLGIAIGLAVVGLTTCLTKLSPSLAPFWPDFSGVSTYFPFLASPIAVISRFFSMTVMLALTIVGLDYFTASWSRRRILGSISLIVLVVAMVSSEVDSFAKLGWTGGGTALFCLAVYILVLRFHLSLLPIIVGTILSLDQVQPIMFDPYPGARLGSFLALIVLILLASYTVKEIRYQKQESSTV